MEKDNSKLRERLSKIWQPPEFISFFEKFAQRGARAIKKRTILFNEGDPLERLYCIKSGFVKLYRLSKGGRESTIYLYGPGHILGIRALTSQDKCAKHYAEAITDLSVITLEREEYFDIIAKHPEFLIDLLHIFISRLNYTEGKLEGFILTDTTARVAYFLSDCVSRFCQNQVGKIELPLSLTHQRIAEFVGSVRETVTMAIQKLEKEGVLTVNRGQVVILDLEKLHEQAMFE